MSEDYKLRFGGCLIGCLIGLFCFYVRVTDALCSFALFVQRTTPATCSCPCHGSCNGLLGHRAVASKLNRYKLTARRYCHFLAFLFGFSLKVFKTRLKRGFHTLLKNVSFPFTTHVESHNPPPLEPSVLVGTRFSFQSMCDLTIHPVRVSTFLLALVPLSD